MEVAVRSCDCHGRVPNFRLEGFVARRIDDGHNCVMSADENTWFWHIVALDIQLQKTRWVSNLDSQGVTATILFSHETTVLISHWRINSAPCVSLCTGAVPCRESFCEKKKKQHLNKPLPLLKAKQSIDFGRRIKQSIDSPEGLNGSCSNGVVFQPIFFSTWVGGDSLGATNFAVLNDRNCHLKACKMTSQAGFNVTKAFTNSMWFKKLNEFRQNCGLAMTICLNQVDPHVTIKPKGFI